MIYKIQYLELDDLSDKDSERFNKDNLFDPELSHCWYTWSTEDSYESANAELIKIINSGGLNISGAYIRLLVEA